MAWDRRSRFSASSSRDRGTMSMNLLESTSSVQPWACSSLSSSEKFFSLYEKMQEDREKKNFESLVCAPCLEQQRLPEAEQQQFPVPLPPTMMLMTDNPGSKIVFPHITSRGSLVGKKVYCRTSIHNNITGRQKSSTQRMRTSLMVLNFYQDRSSSSNSLLVGGKQPTQSSPAAGPADSVSSPKKPDHSLDKEQCRGLFLSLAGAAGMRLICPPLQLPLLEILLFFRQQLSRNRAAALSEGGGEAGLWRFPVNLTLATLRPFCGSLARRCLTAMLCLAQMRIKKNNNFNTTEQQNLTSCMSVPADLYSVAIGKEYNDLDRKQFTTICATDHFQFDDVLDTDADDDDDAIANGARRNNKNHSITLLSKAVVGRKFQEECWNNNDVQVVEILIGESEDSFSERESLSDDGVPIFLAEDQNNIASDPVLLEYSEVSLVDLEEDDLSPKPFLKRSENEVLNFENGLVVASPDGPYVAVEEPRKESFAQSDFAVSPPTFQFPLEVPSNSTFVKAATDWPGNVSILEDSEDSMSSADRMFSAQEEQPESTSVFQTKCDLKTSIEELTVDCESCSPPGRCNEATVSAAQGLAEETVESRNQLGNKLHDGELVHFVEGESEDRFLEEELEGCRIEEHRIDDKNCVSLKGLQVQVEVSPPERTSAESGSEDESSNNLGDRLFEVEFDGDASDTLLLETLPEQMKVSLGEKTDAKSEFEEADVAEPVESLLLALEEAAENQAIEEIQEVKLALCVVEKQPGDRVLDCPIEEHRIGGSVCTSPEMLPDLIELLMDANWIGARKELAKVTAMVPVERQSVVLTDLAESQALKDLQKVKSTHSLVENSTEKALHQELEVCPIEHQALEEIRERISEHQVNKKSAESALGSPIKEHRIDGDDCDDWLESLLEQVEVFIAERADVVTEFEKAAVTDVVENKAVKDILEVNSPQPVQGKLADRLLDQELVVCPIEKYRIDDRGCVPPEGLQRYTEVFPSERRRAENEVDEKESPSPGAATLSVDNPFLPLTESLEKEVVLEIQEVNPTHLIEEELADEVLSQDIQVCPAGEYVIGDSDCESLERLQRENDTSLPSKTSPKRQLEKGLYAVALSVEIQSTTLTELFEGQPIKEIQEVKSSGPVAEKSAERVINEVCPIEGHGIDDRNPELSERLQGQIEVSLPERTRGDSEPEKEPSDNLRGRNSVDFDGDASVLEEEERNCPSSISSQECSNGQERDLLTSSTAIADDANHSGTTSRESYLEHPEFKLISMTGDSSSEPSSQTSLTRRLNSATEAEDKEINPDSGAMAVVSDDELNSDEKDGHIATDAKVQDEIKIGSIRAENDSALSTVPTETKPVVAIVTTVVSVSDENSNLDQSLEVAGRIGGNGENNFFEMCSKSSPLLESAESCGVPQSYPDHPFADHPTCIELRERRHSHGDQTFIDMQELLPAPWGQLIFWHGRCKEGRPTLCVLLGKAVRQLPGHELKNFIQVTVSHLEFAELNFFKGNVKQMNILMDLEGLGFMRLPPMNILSAIGTFLNRDYAGRGGWIILVNAPLMLGFVISAIQGVILRPSNNKGAAIDSSFKGFLEGKERIMMMGGKYRQALQKHFDCAMLPVALGGDCPCGSEEEPCKMGCEFLKLPWDTCSLT